MKKNSIRRIAAVLACAAVAASTIPGIAASAKSNDQYATGYEYYSSVTKKYYDNRDEAIDESNGSAANVYNGKALYFDTKPNFSKTYPYYSTFTKKYYPTVFAAEACSKGDLSKVVYGGSDGSAYYDGNHRYYSSYTTRYYATYAEALSHSANVASYVAYDGKYDVTYNYNYAYSWYSSYTNRYYTTYEAALRASNNNPSYVYGGYYYSNGHYTVNGSGNYYNSLTNTWYTTLASALAASNNNASYVSYTNTFFTTYDWNGRQYATVADAIAAGAPSSADVAEHNYTATAPSKVIYNTTPSYVYNYDYPYYTYKNGYYYSRDGYYYYNGKYYRANPYNPIVGDIYSNKPAEYGVPYLKGYTTKNSWSGLTNYVKNSRARSVVEITMNGATSVPETFMSALKGKDVTVYFTLENGVRWSINGQNISSAKTTNLSVELNDVDKIPDTLVKAAMKKADGMAYSQVAVGSGNDSLNFKGICRIKYSSDRAGSSAKTYLYDPDSNKLTLVYKSVADENGYVSFSASENGTYLTVIY